MEKQYVVRDTHTRSITAVGYNPIRREIVLGCEGRPTSYLCQVYNTYFLDICNLSEWEERKGDAFTVFKRNKDPRTRPTESMYPYRKEVGVFALEARSNRLIIQIISKNENCNLLCRNPR